MSNELDKIIENDKINSLYNNNLFSLKSICQHLQIWDNYSTEEKFRIENVTKRDSVLNKNFTFSGDYDTNLTYGEVTKSGAEEIFKRIIKYKKDFTESDVLIDIGSGCGKFILHSAIRLPIKTYVGLEIVEQRNLYAKHISKKILPIKDKTVFFINKDFSDFDLNIAKVVFCNNLCFSKNLNKLLFEKIPSGCHVIVNKSLNFKIFKESFLVDVSWMKHPFVFHYYIK